MEGGRQWRHQPKFLKSILHATKLYLNASITNPRKDIRAQEDI